MASSFLEDLLEKKIDENEVSAMKGSLESQLASPANGKSAQNEVKQDAGPNKSTTQQAVITTSPAKQGSPASNQAASLRPGIPASRGLSPGNPVTTTVIHIAPRPSVTAAVPLAPRPNTMTVLSQGADGRYITTMINAADLINRNVNVINASQLLGPRMVAGAVTVPGTGQILAPRIIQQLPQRIGVPMAHSPSLQGVQISQDNTTGMLTLTQAPGRPVISVQSSIAGQQNIPLDRTSIAQIRPSTVTMAGTTQFSGPRPMHVIANQHPPAPVSQLQSNSNNASAARAITTSSNPSISTSVLQGNLSTNARNTASPKPVIVNSQAVSIGNSSSPAPQVQTQVKIVNTPIPIEVIKEHAAKLKNFFNNLIRLASEKSPEVGPAVKDLIQKVMEGKLSEEDFAAKLLTTLNSGPQPNLVGFLKKALPMLRHQAQLQALPQQQQPLQITTVGGPKLLPHPQTQVTPQKPTQTQQGTPIQQKVAASQPNIVKLTPAQQQLLHRQRQLEARRVFITASSTGGVSTVARGVAPGMVTAAGSKVTLTAVKGQAGTAGAPKHKQHAGISSSGDDDINDVTSMAGVNLMEESQRILAINSELLSSQTRSCRDELFLNHDALQKKLEVIVKKQGLGNIHQDVCGLISHACQERLRNILEKLSTISLNRPESYRDDPRYEGGLETKAQLRVFEQIDEVERKKRELREREVLMRAAKSRSRQEDPEQARLKEKAKQLQQEEEEIIRKREANNTALAAIGPRKKRKLDEALEATRPSGQSSTSSSPSSTFNSPQNRFTPRSQRSRRVTLKDLVFVLEQEKESTKSLMLYKALLK
ncbi:transcription initiation factor TFIID subunit 4 [Nematostella vectensis]|uniref:transcription initiation factor TFIID subunit 4 n=1 Tax=Nematostella vectensis TaxID=45351 RepID=UPI0020776E54|nr:transcription initiation factor TFIID subunit 4 [Nematostella vectensis]